MILPPIHLPIEQSPGQMVGCWATALVVTAAEIGAMFDAHMKDTIGPNWAPALESVRRDTYKGYRVNLRDPQWVFGEPLKDNSLLAALLPDDGLRRFKEVYGRRNAWFHYNNLPWNLDELEASVDALKSASGLWPALAANQKLGELTGHLFELRQLQVLPGPRELELQRIVEQGVQEREELRAQLEEQSAQLRREMSGRSHSRAHRESLEAQLRENERRARQAEEQAKALEVQLVKVVADAVKAANPDDLLPITIRPGDPWPAEVPLGSRVMKLTRSPAYIFDPARRAYVHAELGDVALRAAAMWINLMPLGGDLHVTDGWNAAGRVNGVWTYLGRLDEAGEQDRTLGANVTEILTPRSYFLLPDDVQDTRSDRLLTECHVADPRGTVERITSAVAEAHSLGLFEDETSGTTLQGGLVLRVSVNGHVATAFGEELGYLTTVTADEWFPGHLRA